MAKVKKPTQVKQNNQKKAKTAPPAIKKGSLKSKRKNNGTPKGKNLKPKIELTKQATGTGSLLKPQNTNSTKLDTVQVLSGIQALLKVISKKQGNSVELFDDERCILMQVTTVKIPKCPPRLIRITLPYSIVHSESEICLITPDTPGQRKEYDKTIEHYEDILKTKKVDVKIKTVIPLSQLKSEYSEYELKLRLVRLYDFFLVDGRVGGYVMRNFGEHFRATRRSPVSIKMNCTNLDDHIKKALLKVEMKIHPNGDTYVIQVGHTRMSEGDLESNILSVFDSLADQFPGGCENIRGIHIKTETSMAIPIYLSLKMNSDVSVPVVLSSRSKHYKMVTGEVSTIHDRNVDVYPGGEVVVQGTKTSTRKSNRAVPVDEIVKHIDRKQKTRKGSKAKPKVTANVKAKVNKNANKMKRKSVRINNKQGTKKRGNKKSPK